MRHSASVAPSIPRRGRSWVRTGTAGRGLVAALAWAAAWLGGAAWAVEQLTVSFKTTQAPGTSEYQPANVVAAWVETSGGQFVRTLKALGNERSYNLLRWQTRCGGIDAVTGATRQNHTATVSAVWDMKNRAGQVVADGTYNIRLELADRTTTAESQNNQATFSFSRNGTASTLTPANQGGFTNVSLVYTGRTQYTLTVQAGTGGRIVLPATSPGTYADGEVVAIQASPDAGYTFAGWTGSADIASPANASTTVTLRANTTLTASFTDLDEQFGLSTTTLSVPEGTSRTFTVALTHQPALSITASVTAVARGDADLSVTGGATLTFSSANWSTPQTVTVSAAEDADAANGSASFRVSDDAGRLTAVTVTATEQDDDRVLTLSADPAEGGTVSPAGATVHEGNPAATVAISATPATADWLFDGWAGQTTEVATPLAASTTVRMGADYAVRAVFRLRTYQLTVTAGTGGRITAPDPAVADYPVGSVVTLTAAADPLYHFTGWTGAAVADDQALSTTIAVTGDLTVQATFAPADDQDGDGLPDDWETGYFGSIGAQGGAGNPDADLYDNTAELHAGTDPTRPTLAFAVGWNLVSVPVVAPAGTTIADQLAGLACDGVWAWQDGAYVSLMDGTARAAGPPMEPLRGYWVASREVKRIDLAGAAVGSGETTLVLGWNLIGAWRGGVIAGRPELMAALWGWNGTAYEVPANLQYMHGYWVYVRTAGAVALP